MSAYSPYLRRLWYHHRHVLHGLLSPRTTTLDLMANIGCSECFLFRYVTNVNHCIVPKALIVPRSKSMRSCLDNGKNVRWKHSLQLIAAPLCAVRSKNCIYTYMERYCVNYNVSSPYLVHVYGTTGRWLTVSTRLNGCQWYHPVD